MKEVEFVLLLYMSGGELTEYTDREGLSECFSPNRTMERNTTIDANSTTGTRISCQKLEVLIDETGSILEFTQGAPGKGGK